VTLFVFLWKSEACDTSLSVLQFVQQPGVLDSLGIGLRRSFKVRVIQSTSHSNDVI